MIRAAATETSRLFSGASLQGHQCDADVVTGRLGAGIRQGQPGLVRQLGPRVTITSTVERALATGEPAILLMGPGMRYA